MSSIPWLGDVRFPTTSAKNAYSIVLGKMLQPAPTTSGDLQTPYLKSASIQWSGVIADPGVTMWASAAERRDLEVRADDLLVCEGGDVGRCAFYSGPSGYIFQNSVHRVRARQRNEVRFFRYVLEALHGSDWLDVLCNKATIRHLTSEKLGSLEIPLPPVDEQRRIADFLDAETARIDELRLLRSRQVRGLSEALDSEVARIAGRNSSFASDREREQWRSIPLRRIVDKMQTGLTPTEYLQPMSNSDLFPWYTPAALGGSLDLMEAEKGIDHADRGLVPRFPAGSILIVGIGESLGKVADLDHEATGNQQLTAITTSNAVDRRFVAWQLFSVRDEIRNWAQYSRVRILNNDVLKSFMMSIPSIGRQVESRKELDRRLAEFVSFRDAAARFSLLAFERRQALITAAVTGQLDVTTARRNIGANA